METGCAARALFGMVSAWMVPGYEFGALGVQANGVRREFTSQVPMTSPSALIALGEVRLPPGSAPRSCGVPPTQIVPGPSVTATIVPASLIAIAVPLVLPARSSRNAGERPAHLVGTAPTFTGVVGSELPTTSPLELIP